jgi:hypothetical protein
LSGSTTLFLSLLGKLLLPLLRLLLAVRSFAQLLKELASFGL